MDNSAKPAGDPPLAASTSADAVKNIFSEDPALCAPISPSVRAQWLREATSPMPVTLRDTSSRRIRRPDDGFSLLFTLFAIVFVLILSVYAHGTTLGVTSDVRNATAQALRSLVLVPITVIESLVVVLIPVAVLWAIAWRRDWRTLITSVSTAIAAYLVAELARLALNFAPDSLTATFVFTRQSVPMVGINWLLVIVTAFLTSSGKATLLPPIRWSWAAIWVITALSVIRATMTLPAALVAVLLGRAVGLSARRLFGVTDRRAKGAALVAGLYAAGLTPLTVARILPSPSATKMLTWLVKPASLTSITLPNVPEAVKENPIQVPGFLVSELVSDKSLGQIRRDKYFVELAKNPPGFHRFYTCTDTYGQQFDVLVFDQDRQILSVLSDLWTNLRLRGLQRETNTSVQAAGERAVLMSLAAKEAGVYTPKIVGIARTGESVMLAQHHISDPRQLVDLNPEEISDELLDSLWMQLLSAHHHGLAHRAIDLSAVVVDKEFQPWILAWHEGEVAAQELSQRVDLAQLLVLLASCVGSKRALASGRHALGDLGLQELQSLLQPLALPKALNQVAKKKNLLHELRDALIDQAGPTATEPINIRRFSPRTVVITTIGVVALWVILGSFRLEDISRAITGANPWWIGAAFGFGLLTYVGAAIPLVAFTPEKINLRDAILTQVAASVVTLVAPAGVGPAALNLRFLNRHRVPTTLALATVTLVQVFQFVTTVVLLILLALATGDAGALSFPSATVIIVVVGIVALVGVGVAIPSLRRFLAAKLLPTWRQVHPRLLWILGRPKRLAAGVGGNILMTFSFVAAFGSSLAAFGMTLSPTKLAVTFLASNSLGSVIPSPGGIGPVEAALTGGLQVAGIPAAVAISTAVVYRLVTFWGRAPLGWIALRHLQKHNLI